MTLRLRTTTYSMSPLIIGHHIMTLSMQYNFIKQYFSSFGTTQKKQKVKAASISRSRCNHSYAKPSDLLRQWRDSSTLRDVLKQRWLLSQSMQ